MSKKSLALILILTSFFLLVGCNKSSKASKTELEPKKINFSQQKPLLFVHGSGGSENDLKPFAKALLQEHDTPTEFLNVHISANNKVNYLNQLVDPEALPVIFVGFADSNGNIEDWGQGLAQLLSELKEIYQFQEINLVGFSNGGLAVTNYTQLFGNKTNYPKVNKLATIGAPFNDLEPLNNLDYLDFDNLNGKTAYFDKFLTVKNPLPQDLSVLAIAGSTNNQLTGSDNVVPVSSALGSRLIFPDSIAYYQEEVALGEKASHIGLISENIEVESWLVEFLFKLPDSATGHHYVE